MKVKRFLTPRATNRFKIMMGAYLFMIAISFLTSYAEGMFRDLEEVDYTWDGHTYSLYERRETPYGYVEEWSDNDIICQR